MQEILIDINKVCRTCLKESSDLQSIFCEDLMQSKKLSWMVKYCTDTEVQEEDEFPHQICGRCIQNVRVSFMFKMQSISSFNTLKDYLPCPSKEGFEDKYIQTDEITLFPCEQCDLRFMNDKDIRLHRLTHTDNVFKCKTCSKTYTRLTHLQRHIALAHREIASFNDISKLIPCTFCNRQFSRTEHMRRHIQTQHKSQCIEESKAVTQPETEQSIVIESFESPIEINKTYEHTGTVPEEVPLEKEKECEIVIEELKSEFYDDSEIIEYVEFGMADDVVTDVEHIEEVEVHIEESLDESDNDDVDIDYVPEPETPSRRTRRAVTKQLHLAVKDAAANKVAANEEIETTEEPAAEKSSFLCTICDKTFKSNGTYLRHCRTHTEMENEKHKCDKCEKTFMRKNHLRRHMFTHDAVKPYKCTKCEKTFTRSEHLNTHLAQHNGLKPFSCTSCTKKFARSEHLRKHIFSQHSDKAPARKEICTICQKGFTTQKYLQIHMKSHDSEAPRTFTCKFCQAQYTDKASLTEHLKIHANERPYLCSECGLRFVRNDYLVIHMRRHKGEKPYKCKFCGKGFPRATDLTVHERYHTGEKTHLCTTCGKGFQRAYNLLVHMRVHTGERPYKCPHCSKSFAQGNDLKAHVRRHTGERYKCEICGDGFIQGYHLTHHKRTVHGLDAQSHIRRVKKFVTITAQEKQVTLQQYQLQLDELKQKQNNLQSQRDELETRLNLKDPYAEPLLIKLEQDIEATDNQIQVLQQQSDNCNQMQPEEEDEESADSQHHNLSNSDELSRDVEQEDASDVRYIQHFIKKEK